MRSIHALLILLLTLTFLGCGSGCNKQGKVDWPKVASCAPQPHDMIGTVQRILLEEGPEKTSIGDRAKNELESLATQKGPELIACLVDMVVREWSRPGASANPDRMAGTARGRDFLNQIGTQTHYPDPDAVNAPPEDHSEPASTPAATEAPASVPPAP